MSHHPLTIEVQIQSQDHQCGICGGQSGSQTPPVTTLYNHQDWQHHSRTPLKKARQTLKILLLSFHVSLSCQMYFIFFRNQLILIVSTFCFHTHSAVHCISLQHLWLLSCYRMHLQSYCTGSNRETALTQTFLILSAVYTPFVLKICSHNNTKNHYSKSGF